ncbi:protein-glutamate methylesterase/protein-glutamine glutaminase [Paenibacillus sp. PL2-23]
MAPYRVLVVDDSAFMRKIISDLILQDGQFEIAATASNGLEAVMMAAELKPDVMTMDLEMPKMNGLDALQLIMKAGPIPIIMLSGISEDNTRDTIKALQFGAFDFIRKPTVGTSGDDINHVGEQLLEKLKTAVLAKRSSRSVLAEGSAQKLASAELTQTADTLQGEAPSKPKPASKLVRGGLTDKPASPLTQAKSNTYASKTDKTTKTERTERGKPQSLGGKTIVPRAKEEPPAAAPSTKLKLSSTAHNPASKGKQAETFKHLVAIGTSTGGPRALHEVICSLPGSFPAPVLIVQHMPPRFTKSLAQRLDSFSELNVHEAEQGMRVAAGHAYIAPGGYHMELAKDGAGYFIRLTEAPQRNGHRPSVDVMFESLLSFKELERHAVVMTGMGSDGARGLKALLDNGAATTIAEAEETCIVYGMPRSAVECGAAQKVLPLQQIASKLVSAVIN